MAALEKLPNFRRLDAVPYERLPSFAARFDVAVMPYRLTEHTRTANPLKLREYIATGKPVVSAPLPEALRFAKHIRIAGDAVAFTAAIEEALADPNDPVNAVAKIVSLPSLTLQTTLTPDRLLAGELQPEKMSVISLLDYISYLDDNNLQTNRQFVALWRKGSYPFTLLVMMTIAAPISFVQTRSGGVGAKVFIGILLGVAFFMFNQLSLNLGMLNNLPAWITALAPNLLGLAVALMALYFMEAKRTTKNHTTETDKKKSKQQG